MAKKIKSDLSYILTANELTTGDVVFWSRENSWTDTLAKASLISNDETEAFAEIGTSSERANEVVGAYLTPVQQNAAAITPVELRERRRVKGPSIAYGAPSFFSRSRSLGQIGMYNYDSHDQAFVEARSREFRDQVERRITGS